MFMLGLNKGINQFVMANSGIGYGFRKEHSNSSRISLEFI